MTESKLKINPGYCREYLHKPKRHLQNKELELWYDFQLNDFPIQTLYGPVVKQYTEQLINTVGNYYTRFPKVFALRFELFFPSDWTFEERLSQDYFSKFIDSFKEQMVAYNKRKQADHDSRDIGVKFCRAIEVGEHRGLHIHVLLLLNGNVFRSPGNYETLEHDYLNRKIIGAWASALFGYDRKKSSLEGGYWCSNLDNIKKTHEDGLVNFGKYWKSLRKPAREAVYEHYENMYDVIYVASYLCKAYSKVFGLGIKSFSCSKR